MVHDIQHTANEAWADVFNKILKTGKRNKNKNLILSKAKRDEDLEKNKLKKIELKNKIKEQLEVVDEKGNVKINEEESEQNTVNNLAIRKKKSEDQSVLLRVKPSLKEKEKEKYLNSIATQGVVQLFNAVEKYQVNNNTTTLKKSNNKTNQFNKKLKQEDSNQDLKEKNFMDIISSSKSWLTDDIC